jgi:hypothetical protein
MASKLFHAVVGVGLSLAGVSACGGSTSSDAQSPDANLPEGQPEGGVDVQSPPPELDAGVFEAAPASDASADVPPDVATADAAPIDAAADVPTDAIVAAFCDLAWPITKAGREACGPIDECMSQPIPWCLGPDGDGGCELYLLECVGAEWHCMGGVIPTNDPGPLSKCQ